MTWRNRFKLLFGLVFVLVVVAAATIVFNQRQTHVVSSSAQIGADHFLVGTDYGGIVSEAFVEEGDTVTEGEKMFTVRSMQLARDLATGATAQGSEIGGTDGTLIVRASSAGVVSEVDLGEGSFAGAGSVLATIEAAGTLYAEAEFVLTPRDFGRIDDRAAVEIRLPDGTTFAGRVTDITVETEGGNAHVTARIESKELTTETDNPLFKPGTPLDASLELRDDGPLAGVHDAISDLARKIGL